MIKLKPTLIGFKQESLPIKFILMRHKRLLMTLLLQKVKLKMQLTLLDSLTVPLLVLKQSKLKEKAN